MVSLNKSFIYGICFASVTWTISLYLLWQLTQQESHPSSTEIKSLAVYPNDVIIIKESLKSYKNTEQVIQRLQPKILNSDDLGLVRTEEERLIKEQGYKRHAFNVLISNRIGLIRDIPDTRNKLCKSTPYPKKLPKASIIICFYNEHNTTLLRSVQSIIKHTPNHLLHEIILINDQSDKDLKLDLISIKTHLSTVNNDQNLINNELKVINDDINKVKYFETERREGLIRARIFGARKASGDVLIFLDSHIEVNERWIEPLLDRIYANRSNVVMPVIDVINADTFAYSASPLVRGGFNWGLHFKWENLPTGTLVKDEDFIKPIKSPTMAGGLFAIDRKYFKELGEYDAGMNVWGGENIEISLRIWMCGGKLELIPCSRVGHVFRQRRPYGSPDGQDTMLYNSLRVAHVWLDDYKIHFLKNRKSLPSYGDITSRIKLREELKCHNFEWYLKNIYPELTLPTDDDARLKKKWAALEQNKFQPWHLRKRNYTNQYRIRLTDTNLCIQSAKDVKTKGSRLLLKLCSLEKSQIWHETDKSELVLSKLLCLQQGHPEPHLYKCHEMGADQEWKHKGEMKSAIYNVAAGMCLGATNASIGSSIIMQLCSEHNYNKWDMIATSA